MCNLAQGCAKLRCLVVVCIFAAFSQPLHAISTEDFNFAVEPLLGVKCGTLGEYVYTKDTCGDDAKLSELDWDMKPIFYGGMGALFAYKAFHLDARLRLYFPSNCDAMTDSDWVNVTIPGAVNSKTNYSKSDNAINFGMLFNLKASWQVNLPHRIVLYPFASFEWETLDFRARNGKGVYADAAALASNNGQPKEYKRGELMGIDYKRCTLFTWTGFTFRISGRTSVIANVAYTFLRELKGDTYAKTDSDSFKRDKTSSARADFRSIDISIGTRYRFVP